MDRLTLLIFMFAAGAAIIGSVIAFMLADSKLRRSRRGRLDAYVGEAGEDSVSEEHKDEFRQRQLASRIKALAEQKRFKRSRIGALHALTVQAGLDIGITRFWTICIVFALGVTALYWLSGIYPILMPYVFLMFLFFVPRFWLKRRAAARQREYTKHFPDAMDILVRGLESGLPLAESIRVISTEIPDPVASEFRIVVSECNAGFTLGEALDRSYTRLPTQELRFFSTIVSIQAQTGGNLAHVLGGISKVLRDRSQLKEKAKALSAEAKMSAAIVGALPFLVGTFLFFFNRDYILILYTNTIGNLILLGAAAMMATGVTVMNRMGKLDV